MDKLISSEKLIHDLSGIRDTLPDIFLKNVMSAAISCVEKQPQALCDYDLENMKPGQWIDAHEKYPQFRMGEMSICPRCDAMIAIPHELPIMSYCPNCGKRMYRRDSEDDVILLLIGGVYYYIADITLRMLTPRELYNAMGFPPDYIIDHDYMGNAYVKTKQVARCGNAVCPPLAEAMVRANLPEWCGEKITTMAQLDNAVAV